MEHAEAHPCGQVGRGLKLILLGNRYKIVQLYEMKRKYTSRRSPLAYMMAICLVIFVLAELVAMVAGSNVSLIEKVLRMPSSYTPYLKEVQPANEMGIPVILEEQMHGLTTNAPPELDVEESLQNHTHRDPLIEPEINEIDDEIEPVG